MKKFVLLFFVAVLLLLVAYWYLPDSDSLIGTRSAIVSLNETNSSDNGANNLTRRTVDDFYLVATPEENQKILEDKINVEVTIPLSAWCLAGTTYEGNISSILPGSTIVGITEIDGIAYCEIVGRTTIQNSVDPYNLTLTQYVNAPQSYMRVKSESFGSITWSDALLI